MTQIGTAIGRTIYPIRPPGVETVAVPRFPPTRSEVIPAPALGPSILFKVENVVMSQSPTISQDLLFNLSEVAVFAPPEISQNLLFNLPQVAAFAPSLDFSSQILSPARIDFSSAELSSDLLGVFLRAQLTRVSNNLFVPLAPEGVRGSAFQDRNLQKQESMFPGMSSPRVEGFKKAYTRSKNSGTISTHTTQSLTIWDLIYPLLLPPLNLDAAPQIEILNKLWPYQRIGISFLVGHESALLADEMGTGKTVMSLVALRMLFQKGNIRKALIVCPVGVLRVWQDHLLTWASELEFTVVRGSKEVRKLDWQYPAHVYLTAYDSVATDFLTIIKKRSHLKCPKCHKTLHFTKKVHVEDPDAPPQFTCGYCGESLTDIPLRDALVESNILSSFDIVIADEAQYIKNRAADRSRAIKALNPKIRWALTGTPIENKLDDLVSIFEFVKPNYLYSENLSPSLAKELIKPYFLRRLKKDVLSDLPEKIKQECWLELDDNQREEYERTLRGEVTKLNELGAQVSRVHIFAVITALKRICNFARKEESSPKTEFLVEQVREVKDSGHKAIVFTQWADSYGVATLGKVLEPFGVAVLKGGLSDSEQDAAVQKFKLDPDTAVLLSTVKTGGVGLTLTEANYVFHFDHWWNPATMWQAEDRVHRPGQEHGVNIYSFWVQNTIEERIHQKLLEKGLLFEEVVNGLSDKVIDDLFSTEEWLEVLGLEPQKQKGGREQPRETKQINLSEIMAGLAVVEPTGFEQVVKVVFEKLGFLNVRTTQKSHDGGIDLVCYRRTIAGTEKTIAQCKRVRTVGVETGRELLGVVEADRSIAKAFLVTSGAASPECRAFCEKDARLSVIEGSLLATYMLQFEISVPPAADV